MEHLPWTELSIMVMAPHPDDEVIGVGGTVARALRSGAHVDLIIGSWRDERRLAEATQAAKCLGAANVIGVYQNPVDEMPERTLVARIEELLEDHRPHLFLIPENAVHPEHRAWFRASVAATRPSGGTGRWRPPHIWCWESPADQWGGPIHTTTFVEISEEDLACKIAALNLHRSQARPAPSERSPEAITALAQLRGMQAGTSRAEAFRVLRDLW